MHQLGLSAADVALFIQGHTDNWADRLQAIEKAAVHDGLSPEQARQFAMVRYIHEYTESLLEANNRKIAADLIRLGVLTGTITKNGEPTF